MPDALYLSERLSRTSLERLAKNRTHKLVKVKDSQCQGLAAYLTARGLRWVYIYQPRGTRPDGRRFGTTDVTIGTGESMSLEEAREFATELTSAHQRGEDVGQIVRRPRMNVDSLGAMVDAYKEKLLARVDETTKADRLDGRWVRTRKGLSAAYVRNEIDYLACAVTGLGVGRRVRDIKRADVIRCVVEPLTAEGHRAKPYHVCAALRRFFDHLVEHEILPVNPAAFTRASTIKPTRPPCRDRVLDEDEIAGLLAAFSQLERYSADIAAFLLYIPARESEVAGMRWEDIDFKRRQWTQPAATNKTQTEHRFHLHPLALELLQRRAADGGTRGLVFPGPKTGNLYQGWTRLKARITKLAGARIKRPWTWHDFRRTYSTILATMGVDEVVFDLTLNHAAARTRSGSTRPYQHSDRWEERVAAAEQWAALLQGLASHSEGLRAA